LKECKEFINRENCKEINKGGRGDSGEGNLTCNVRIEWITISKFVTQYIKSNYSHVLTRTSTKMSQMTTM